MRAKNQYTRAQAKRMHADTQVSWRAWESRVRRLFKANSHRYWWFHLKALPTRELNKRFLPAGWPDFFAVGKPGSDREGTIFVAELKSGKGKLSEEQSFVLKALLLVPGVRGGTFYPHDYPALVKEVGDDVVG